MARHPALVTNFEARSLLLIASLTLGAAGSGLAQNTVAPAPAGDAQVSAAFNRADKNADGKLSLEEAASLPAVEANFDRADADKDGMISPAEFAQAMKM